jgi:hypothetical protein
VLLAKDQQQQHQEADPALVVLPPWLLLYRDYYHRQLQLFYQVLELKEAV